MDLVGIVTIVAFLESTCSGSTLDDLMQNRNNNKTIEVITPVVSNICLIMIPLTNSHMSGTK